MPKRTDIKSILIIGAGPIIIGQACEFDYSGVQACKALREEGYKVILINFAGVWAMARVLLPRLLGRRGKALVAAVDGWLRK